jgi:hypothetical protein
MTDEEKLKDMEEKAEVKMESMLQKMFNELIRTTPVDEAEEAVTCMKAKLIKCNFSVKEARSEIAKVVNAATTILAVLDFETMTDGKQHKADCACVELFHDGANATFIGLDCATRVMDWIAQQADRVNHERYAEAKKFDSRMKWQPPFVRLLAHNASYELSQIVGLLDNIETTEVGTTFYGASAVYVSRSTGGEATMFDGKLWVPTAEDEVCSTTETLDIERGKQCIELLSKMDARTPRQEGNLQFLRAITMSEPTRKVAYQKNQTGSRYAVAQSITTVEGQRKRGLSMQGAPREVRALLCGAHSRDFDIENAIPTIMVSNRRLELD